MASDKFKTRHYYKQCFYVDGMSWDVIFILGLLAVLALDKLLDLSEPHFLYAKGITRSPTQAAKRMK